MALKVIGSGLGRTGTLSLKAALTQLGLGPCHHMIEVFPRPDSMPLWIAVGQGKPDWDALFDGFQSAVDYPSAHFWRELAAYYPQARVIHSVRDADEWFDSTQASIFAANGPMGAAPAPVQAFFATFTDVFGDKIHDRAFMTDYFRRHTDAVIASIPADRLLVWRTSDGWAPLCAFLGLAVPDAPFPRLNSRESFRAEVKQVEGDLAKLKL